MKILFSALLILLNYTFISAQENKSEAPTFVPTTFRDLNKLPPLLNAETLKPTASKLNFDSSESKRKDSFRASVEAVFEIDFDKKVSRFADKNRFSQTKTGEKFRWKPALIQSGIFLGIQHGFRLMQRKTRRRTRRKIFQRLGKINPKLSWLERWRQRFYKLYRASATRRRNRKNFCQQQRTRFKTRVRQVENLLGKPSESLRVVNDLEHSI